MSKLVVLPRRGGKTFAMIRWMVENPTGTVVTISEMEADRVRHEARALGVDISRFRIISCHRVRSHGGLLGVSTPIAVDNADMVLEALFGRPIDTITVTG